MNGKRNGRPLVSCVVPVFNSERYLGEALESIFQQTHSPLEVIVVDDGSTDATAAVIASQGDRVRAFAQTNSGPAAARNRGVREARGEFVAFLDADDLWVPEKLGRQLERFAERPELHLCFSQLVNFWIPELEEEAARFREHRLAKPVPALLAATLLARRTAFDTAGEFDPSRGYTHSTEWLLRVRERGLVSETLPEVLYRRRMHHGNRSRIHAGASRGEYLDLVKAHLDRRRRGAGRAP